MKIPTIQTHRLFLRPWTPEDAPVLFQILQEPEIFQYFPPSPPPTLEKTGRYITHQLAHWQDRGYGHWAVISQDDNRVVGWAGLEYLPELDQTEVAYLLSRKVWGRGYATEAARAAVGFGFETCRLPGIIGLVHPENAASIRVLEKCGLVFTDRLTLWGLEMLRYSARRQE
ncbi:MAG: GNAT family N-acetyltransferase [Chloroflexi bacterium]|nr:GNAT family N-acetyltransferase [Chloroflexota bacterium]